MLGRGITIGRTIGLLLTRKAVNATVTLCHTGTKDVRDHMRRADVIVAAMGVAGFVKPEDIKEGSILVDVGVSRVFDEESGRYQVKGDVDKACYEKASAYTPNPGGVGPMTRAMLSRTSWRWPNVSCEFRDSAFGRVVHGPPIFVHGFL